MASIARPPENDESPGHRTGALEDHLDRLSLLRVVELLRELLRGLAGLRDVAALGARAELAEEREHLVDELFLGRVGDADADAVDLDASAVVGRSQQGANDRLLTGAVLAAVHQLLEDVAEVADAEAAVALTRL